MEKAIRKMFRGRTFLQVHGCVENTIRERTWHGTMERGGDAFWRVIMPRRSEEDLCLTAPPPLPGHVSSTIAKPKASIYFPSFSFRIYKNIYTHTHRYSSPINASFFPPLSLFRVYGTFISRFLEKEWKRGRNDDIERLNPSMDWSPLFPYLGTCYSFFNTSIKQKKKKKFENFASYIYTCVSDETKRIVLFYGFVQLFANSFIFFSPSSIYEINTKREHCFTYRDGKTDVCRSDLNSRHRCVSRPLSLLLREDFGSDRSMPDARARARVRHRFSKHVARGRDGREGIKWEGRDGKEWRVRAP